MAVECRGVDMARLLSRLVIRTLYSRVSGVTVVCYYLFHDAIDPGYMQHAISLHCIPALLLEYTDVSIRVMDAV